jgi:hypothetical protein
MRIVTVSLLICLGAGYMSQAAADEPKQQSPAATQAAPAAPACTPGGTTPCNAPAANTTVAAATTPAASIETDEALDKSLRSRGYKVEVKNGTTYYCRRELVVGSHFESKVCSTSDQMRHTQQDTKDAIDKIARQQPGPVSK